MRFGAFLPFALFTALLPASLSAQGELSSKQAESALSPWFPSTCAPGATNSQMTLSLVCTPKNNPSAPPLLIGAATLDATELSIQIGLLQSAASKPKTKHRKGDRGDVLETRMARQEQSPRGRFGFYGAHPGITESALSFVVVDPTTRRSLQLMYTYRAPAADVPINAVATAKSMDAIFENLKRAGFALEKRYWR